MAVRRSPNQASLGREQRHQTSVSIRKRGRDTRVAAERTAGNDPPSLPLSEDEINSLKRFGIPQLVADFRSGTGSIMRAAMATRKLLSADRDAEGLVDKLVALGLVSDLCQTLDRSDSPRLQFEGLFALTNCSLLRPEAVVREGALPKIVHLLDSNTISLKEQALWSLGNIMSKSSAYRNQCLSLGVVERIRRTLDLVYPMSAAELEAYSKANEGSDSLAHTMVGVPGVPVSRSNFLRQATWAMSNAIRGGDVDDEILREVGNALPILREMLQKIEDPGILANVMWTLADFAERRPRSILELGIANKILELALHPHEAVQGAASQCISTMCSGDGQSMRALMVTRRSDLIFCSHLRSERVGLWLNASWTLSLVCSELSTVCERLVSQIETFLERLCDRNSSSEVRQDCAAIISAVFCTDDGAENLMATDRVVAALAAAMDESLRFDIDLSTKLIQCTVNLAQKSGRRVVELWEQHGGNDKMRMLEQATMDIPTSSPLYMAMESLASVIEDVNRGDVSTDVSPTRQSMIRNQPRGFSGSSRLTFQAFMKE